MIEQNNYFIIYKNRIRRHLKRLREFSFKGKNPFGKPGLKLLIIPAAAIAVLSLSGLLIFLFSLYEPRFSMKELDLSLFSDRALFEQMDRYVDFQDYAELDPSGETSYQRETLEVQNYKVGKGETLGGIARKHGLSLGTLISYNNISDVRKVRSGSELQVPSRDGVLYTVQKGDSLEGLAARFQSDFNLICDTNNITTELIRIGQQLFLPNAKIDSYTLNKAMGRLFRKPASGRLTSPFGYRSDPFTGKRRMHYGIDIANRLGTPILSSMEGTVLYVDERPKGYGKVVVVKHRDGYQSLYAHLHRISVRKGQWISQGTQVGTMGSTGRSTGVHLHFSIFRNNSALNPLNFVHY